MNSPEDYLEDAQVQIEAEAEGMKFTIESDRREFIFRSLVAAAAVVFASPYIEAGAGAVPQQPPTTPFELGNGEPISWTFQPYPGGTGALVERVLRESGAKAFDRSVVRPENWSGSVPTSDEDIAYLPAHRLSALLQAKRITSARLTRIYLDRLKRLNPVLNCAVTIMEAQALAEADRADAELRAGRSRGPLHGIPYGVKDLFSTKGVPTTWGAEDFRNRIIDNDAAIVVRLRDAGAVLIAKLATGLFAQNDWWFGGRTNNPWNPSQGSSGSSAGPASATAAGCVAFSIGTETQGSIVSPSLRCGISALRPTFGRVSRAGGLVLAWSMDRVGPMCRTVEDCAMVFSVIHGADASDPSTITMPFQFRRDLKVSSVRVGVDRDAPGEFVETLRELGAKPVEIGPRPTVPGMGNSLNIESAAAFDAYVRRKARETGVDLSAPPQQTGGQGARGVAGGNPMAPADWNPRFVNGRFVAALDFVQNQRRRYELIRLWDEFMKDLDLFVGGPSADIVATAQTGHPCVVLPYKFGAPAQPGTTAGAQPVCAVVTGGLYNDDVLLSFAHQFQKATEFHLGRPQL